MVVLTVGDARAVLKKAYPKCYNIAFKYAFYARPDEMPLRNCVDEVRSDVPAWLATLPMKTPESIRSLSRAKFGLTYVLKQDGTKADLGEEFCDTAVKEIDEAWEKYKQAFIAALPKKKKKAERDEEEEDEEEEKRKDENIKLKGKNFELQEKLDYISKRNDLLSKTLVELLDKHYDKNLAELFAYNLAIK